MVDPALTVRYDNGVLHAVGEIDMFTSSRLDEVLCMLDTTSPTLVDLSEVAFMDSHGLRVLVHHNNLRAHDCGLTIVNPSRPVRRLLLAAGLENEFHVVAK